MPLVGMGSLPLDQLLAAELGLRLLLLDMLLSWGWSLCLTQLEVCKQDQGKGRHSGVHPANPEFSSEEKHRAWLGEMNGAEPGRAGKAGAPCVAAHCDVIKSHGLICPTSHTWNLGKAF